MPNANFYGAVSIMLNTGQYITKSLDSFRYIIIYNCSYNELDTQ